MKLLPLEQEMSRVASRMYVKKKKCVNQYRHSSKIHDPQSCINQEIELTISRKRRLFLKSFTRDDLSQKLQHASFLNFSRKREIARLLHGNKDIYTLLQKGP